MRRGLKNYSWFELYQEVLELRQRVDELQKQASWSAMRAGAFSEALLRVGIDPRKIERQEIV